MPESGQQHAASSAPGGDGVRVIVKSEAAGLKARGLPLAASLLLGAGLVYLLLGSESAQPPPAKPAPMLSEPAPAPAAAAPAAPLPVARSLRRLPVAPTAPPESDGMADTDPDDLAAYFRPGDPEPTAAELIEALNHAGIRSGIGAFNPPGTSPPLAGLAVPEDFDLPEGFVRHHQVTDEGEPLEAILMFSPDYEFYDAEGRLVAIPENRIVPPELAPPGLPIREMVPPKP